MATKRFDVLLQLLSRLKYSHFSIHMLTLSSPAIVHTRFNDKAKKMMHVFGVTCSKKLGSLDRYDFFLKKYFFMIIFFLYKEDMEH